MRVYQFRHPRITQGALHCLSVLQVTDSVKLYKGEPRRAPLDLRLTLDKSTRPTSIEANP